MDTATSESEIAVTNVLYPGISDSRSKHPEYALLRARQNSFYLWSSDNEVDTTTLSKAGFFFTGIRDYVRCFFCGGGLKDWQRGDNPWIEHARWFPKCDYVKLCMGEGFVNSCSAGYRSEFVEIRKGVLSQEYIPEDWLIRKINSDAAQTFMFSGFSQSDVENGILQIRENGVLGSINESTLRYKPELCIGRSLLHQHMFQAKPAKFKGYWKLAKEASVKTRFIIRKTLLPQEIESLENKRNSTEITSSPSNSLNEEYPIPNLVFRGSNFQLPEATMKLAVDESKREEEQLREENQKLRDIAVCKVCLDLQAMIVFLPCGHFVSCSNCADRLSNCAICRTNISQRVLVQ